MSHDKTHIVEKDRAPYASPVRLAPQRLAMASSQCEGKKKYNCTIVKIGGLASRMWSGRGRVQTDRQRIVLTD